MRRGADGQELLDQIRIGSEARLLDINHLP